MQKRTLNYLIKIAKNIFTYFKHNMKTSPINFTGIKNTGYCWVNKEINNHHLSKCSLNTQLTYSDKKEYENLISRYPRFRNEIASNFANIEMQQDVSNKGITYILKLNDGILNPFDENERPVMNFVKNLLKKVETKKEKDFVVNKDYISSDDCHFGIVYDDDFDKYMDGTAGTIGICGNQPIPDKYHDDVLEVLHEPPLVKGGARYLSSFIETLNKMYENSKY